MHIPAEKIHTSMNKRKAISPMEQQTYHQPIIGYDASSDSSFVQIPQFNAGKMINNISPNRFKSPNSPMSPNTRHGPSTQSFYNGNVDLGS